MSKVFFNIFQNNGENKKDVTFRKFSDNGGHEDVTADYRISGVGDNPPNGSAIKDKSKAGNTVIRVNVGIHNGSGRNYWRGTLNFDATGMSAIKAGKAQPDGERSGLYGTFTNKDKKEMDVAGWVRVTKNGQVFISCSMDEPWQKGKAAPEPARAAAASAGSGYDDSDADDIPF